VKDGPPKLSVAQWCTFLLASFSYAVLTVAFSMSVDYTTVNDAAILTNSQSLLLVVAKLCLGNSVHYLESTGVLVAFGGAYLCSRDSSEAAQIMDDHTNPWLSLYGDGLAVLSAIGGLGYIMLGKSLRNHVEVYVFMTLNMLIGSTMILSFMTLTGQTWTFDRHIDHGMFGWMNLTADRIVVELCVVFICNLCGTMGYVRAFKYFSSVIIAVAALLEPV
jgi:drug/metabolite transporter (DMT)-like permease